MFTEFVWLLRVVKNNELSLLNLEHAKQVLSSFPVLYDNQVYVLYHSGLNLRTKFSLQERKLICAKVKCQ